jgi:starvation-inducible DNA-binding protein
MAKVSKQDSRKGESSPLRTPTDLSENGVAAIADAINSLVCDAFTLYVKTKNFHWHMSGPHFRDYHLLLDEQAEQIFATIDPLAERVRKLGATTVKSVAQIGKQTRIQESEAGYVAPLEMLRELVADNRSMAAAMREAHGLCDDNDDIATASLLEEFVDQTERRTWFLFEASRAADPTGH